MADTHGARAARTGRPGPLASGTPRLLAADAVGTDARPVPPFFPGGGGRRPRPRRPPVGRRADHVIGARKGGDLYLIPAEGDPLPTRGHLGAAAARRGTSGRTALMRTHSALHVLCGVVLRDFGAGHWRRRGAADRAVGLSLPRCPPGFREAVESACNAEVLADRRSTYAGVPRDEAFALADIIRTGHRCRGDAKEVRIIDVVAWTGRRRPPTSPSTRQVGRIEVVKIESKGKGFRRLRGAHRRLASCLARSSTERDPGAAPA